ncbi:MAG: ankyrin repeat domain-containing protein, partial [Verrucomicrobia bacterium]|nr:ankyrin repeat domain-containing protein [Verrucomicrobiota bacterium]
MRSNQGATPLAVAIQHEQLEAVRFLLKKENDQNFDILSYLFPALPPIIESIESLFPHNAGKEEKLHDGYTLLHCAARTGNKEIVEELLKSSKRARQLINQQTNEGITPLMLACQAGCVPLVQYLIDQGAKATLEMKNGTTALDIAVKSDNLALCEILFPLSNLSVKTVQTALKNASFEINKLFAARSSYAMVKSPNGDNPFMMALQEANIPVAAFLLKRLNEVFLYRKNDLGVCPVLFSAECGFYTILEELVKRRPDAVPKMELFKRLLKAGFSGNNAFFEKMIREAQLSQKELQELLGVAASAGNCLGIEKILLPKGVDLASFKDAKGWKIEQYLAKFNDRLQLEQYGRKNPVSILDGEGKTLAYIAAENGSWDVLG